VVLFSSRMKNFKFNYKYFLFSIFFFLIEVVVERYFHGGFVRNVLGDYLVVFLIYCFVKAFLNIKPLLAASLVLLLSYLIEIAQYVNILKLLNISQSKTTAIVLGSSFDWKDMAAYTSAFLTILLVEKMLGKKSS